MIFTTDQNNNTAAHMTSRYLKWNRGNGIMEPDLCHLVKMDPNVKDAPPPPPPRPADAMPKDRLPTPEEVAKIIENHPELHKPLFFANHQKKFIAFTWLTIIGMTIHAVFFQEYPQEEHCFSPIRRFTSRLKDRFFKVDIEQDEVVKNRIQELKDKLEAKKAEEVSYASSS